MAFAWARIAVPACCRICARVRAAVSAAKSASRMRLRAALRFSEVACRFATVELKRFCSEHLPLYMVPDAFSWHDALPRTSTDKTDYQRLKELA